MLNPVPTSDGKELAVLTPVALFALAAIVDNSPAPSARTIEVATCAVANGRSAKVTRIGDRYTYTFGKAGHPEIRLDPDPAANAVFKHADMFPRAGLTQLRFGKGTTSYVLKTWSGWSSCPTTRRRGGHRASLRVGGTRRYQR